MRPRTPSSRRRDESGYALITILFLLGVVAVMLAQSLPRDAMRAQRTREETLIFRGEQYARAVELYFRANRRYPETMDDLEEKDGVRFLRRRYRDPITGDDQWRLIKMGADGRFEDSLVYDTERDEDANNPALAHSFAPAMPTMAGVVEQTPNPAAVQRQTAAPNPFESLRQRYGANFNGVPDGQPQPEIGPDGQPLPGSPLDYTQTPPGQVPENAGQRDDPRLAAAVPTPADPNAQVQQAGSLYPTQPQGFGRDSLNPQAANLLSNLLTQPRPGGLAGLQGQTAPQQAQAAFQEGIAGVASKAEGSGVKVYKDHELYSEWEFVYDYRKAAGQGGAAVLPAAGGVGVNPGQPGLTPSGVLPGSVLTPTGPGPQQPPPGAGSRQQRRQDRFGSRQPGVFTPRGGGFGQGNPGATPAPQRRGR